MGDIMENEGGDDKAKEIFNKVQKALDDLSDWRKKARESYDFYAGDQWTQEEQDAFKADFRPAIVYNKTARTVNAIIGLEANNRYDITYEPFEVDDGSKAQIFTETVKYLRDKTDAEDEESEMFEDCVISGYGFQYTTMDYVDEPDGMMVQRRVDPLMMAWDSDSTKKNLTDATWFAEIKRYSKKQLRAAFPDVEIEALNPTTLDLDDMKNHSTDNRDYPVPGISPSSGKKAMYDVVCYQYFDMEDYYRIEVQGQEQELTPEEFAAMKEQLDAAGVVYVKQARKIFKECVVCGDKVLSENILRTGAFGFKAITGLRVRNKNYFIGIVELMKDPQKWANKWLTQINYILSLNAKGGIMAEDGAFKDIGAAENDWANPSKIVTVNPNKMDKIKPRHDVRYPDGLDRLLQYALGAVTEVTGVNSEMLGLTDRYQAGYLERERKQAGVNILSKFFDGMRLYRKLQGRLLAEFVRNYIPDGTMVRINEGPTKKYIPFTRDVAVIKYDIVVDQSPYSTNMKERTYQILKEVIPTMLQVGTPIPPQVVKYLPIPTTLADEWMAYIEQSQNDPAKENARKLDEAQKAADVKETESKAMLNQAKAQAEGATGQVDLLKSKIDLQKTAVKAQADTVKANLSIQKSVVDAMKPPTPMNNPNPNPNNGIV